MNDLLPTEVIIEVKLHCVKKESMMKFHMNGFNWILKCSWGVIFRLEHINISENIMVVDEIDSLI